MPTSPHRVPSSDPVLCGEWQEKELPLLKPQLGSFSYIQHSKMIISVTRGTRTKNSTASGKKNKNNAAYNTNAYNTNTYNTNTTKNSLCGVAHVDLTQTLQPHLAAVFSTANTDSTREKKHPIAAMQSGREYEKVVVTEKMVSSSDLLLKQGEIQFEVPIRRKGVNVGVMTGTYC